MLATQWVNSNAAAAATRAQTLPPYPIDSPPLFCVAPANLNWNFFFDFLLLDYAD
jgi:hypothetical protein